MFESGDVLSGMVRGVELSENLVRPVFGARPRVNGALHSDPEVVGLTCKANAPLLSFDGKAMNFLILSPDFAEGFQLIANQSSEDFAALFGMVDGALFLEETFEAGNWSLTLAPDIAEVPLPASGLLLIAGLTGVTALCRKAA